MTTLGRDHSTLLGGLVYIDAIADLEDDPPADAEWLALQQKLPSGVSQPPSCGPLERSTFDAFHTTWSCRLGFARPVSDLHHLFEDEGGRVGAARMPGWVSRAMGQSPRRKSTGCRISCTARNADRRSPPLGRRAGDPRRHPPARSVSRHRARMGFSRAVAGETGEAPRWQCATTANTPAHLLCHRRADFGRPPYMWSRPAHTLSRGQIQTRAVNSVG